MSITLRKKRRVHESRKRALLCLFYSKNRAYYDYRKPAEGACPGDGTGTGMKTELECRCLLFVEYAGTGEEGGYGSEKINVS